MADKATATTTKTIWVTPWPRYTTLYGAHEFTTDFFDIAYAYEFQGELYRGEMDGDASITVSLEESNDGVNWDSVFVGDPGADSRQDVYAELTKSLMRAVVELSTTGSVIPSVSLWLVGMLYRRRP